jgi:beta-lactam-binding protein with PASTA domain
MNSAAQLLPNLTGLTISEAIIILENYGFQFTSISLGGYQNFAHSDGSIIHIRPNGEIVRTGPKIKRQDGKIYRHRYNQFGTKIKFQPGANTHNTGEYLIL